MSCVLVITNTVELHILLVLMVNNGIGFPSSFHTFFQFISYNVIIRPEDLNRPGAFDEFNANYITGTNSNLKVYKL